MGLFGSGGIVPSIGGFMGDIITGGAVSNAKGVEQANQATMGDAQANRGFQERMSNSAWQRGTEDMRKAGLNPALAYTQGPASSPSGAQGKADAVRSGDIGGMLGTSAKQAMGLKADLAKTDADTKTSHTQAELNKVIQDKTSASATETRKNTEKLEQETRRAAEETKISSMKRKIIEANMPAEKNKAEANEKSSKADAFMAYPDAIMDRAKSWIPLTRSSAKTYNTNHINKWESGVQP
jgi:hypothetical protein